MEQTPAAVTIPGLLANVIRLINDFQRKNTTMVDYYIRPAPVPTEIAAYEPRLLLYRTRVESLSKLNLGHLSGLADNASAFVVSYALQSVKDLAAASISVQKIFIEHYDRRLEQSLPYRTIQETFRLYMHQLQETMRQLMSDPSRQSAEHLLPPTSSTRPSLCRGATAFINNRDHGKPSNVPESDLTSYYRNRLADRGGVILWWECSVCAFKLRYHASSSANLSINHTDEIIIEDDIETVAYRPSWLVKCHIYHPRNIRPQAPLPAPSPPTSPQQRNPEPTSPIPPRTQSQPQRPQPAPKRISFSRRKSTNLTPTAVVTETTTTRFSTVSPPTSPLSPSASRPQPSSSLSSKRPMEPTGPHGLKYYCPFCVAQGKELVSPRDRHSSDSSSSADSRRANVQPTCFERAKDLVEHIDDRHTRDRPVGLLLQALRVAVQGQAAPTANGRWDLDLR